jgi:CheY-like chemotaxis protein
LAFSRKSGVEPRLIDLGAVVADTGRMLRRIVGEDIELSVAREPDAGTVWADPGQIEQVVLNLVVNARDAVARGGKIAVGVANAELDEAAARALPGARPGPHVLLAVSDTGCGMDAATAARAFEPFFTTKGASGTGLGLATVQAVVRGCGGAVAVETEPGRGTTFRVYLPRATDPAPGDVPQRGAEAMQRGNGTVLVVEDEAAVRTIVRHVLTGCGYAVLEAADGAEAVRVAAAHPGRLDVIVSDVVLPDLGGREVVARVAASHPEAKVLFVSGYDEGSLDRYGVPEARAAFLQKPFTPATLTAKVREVMEATSPA